MDGIRFGTVSDPHHICVVHDAAGDAIPGYTAAAPLAAVETRQMQLETLFAGHGPAPQAATVAVALDAWGHLLGAAILETPYRAAVVDDDPQCARNLAVRHRTLAALFVKQQHQRRGIASHLLLKVAGRAAINSSARFIDGFVDDRTGSVNFYRRVGARVMAHNDGLPPRWPANVKFIHPPGYDGHWFYLDLWPIFEGSIRCTRCQEPLRFEADGRGSLVCDSCGPASGIGREPQT